MWCGVQYDVKGRVWLVKVGWSGVCVMWWDGMWLVGVG